MALFNMMLSTLARQLCVALGLFFILALPLSAQLSSPLSFPPLTDTGSVVDRAGRTVVTVVTPAHAEFTVRRFEVQQLFQYPLSVADLPLGEVKQRTAQFASEQLQLFPQVLPFYLHPYGLMAFAANADSVARQSFNRWLATPKLSVPDQVSAYIALFQVQADALKPYRFPEALATLKHLERLGPQYFEDVYRGYQQLFKIYETLKQPEEMLKSGERLLELALSDTMNGWGSRANKLVGFPLIAMAQIYAGRTSGAARIATMTASYRAGFELSVRDERAHERTRDKSSVARYQRDAAVRIEQVALLGQTAPVVLAHAWLNRGVEERVAEPVPLNLSDGKVRIIEFGYWWCQACKNALPGMQRLTDRFRGQPVEIIYVTETEGKWGVDLVSPSEEIEHLKGYFVDDRKWTFPVGIWAGDKVPAEEDGMLPVPSPNPTAFRVKTTPTFVFIDGTGRVRRIVSGYDSLKRSEKEFASIIEELLPR